VFKVQDEISNAIVTAISPELTGTATTGSASTAPSTPAPAAAVPSAPVANRGTSDLQAYDLYLRGRYFFDKRGEAGLRRALDYFQQASQKDSNFARAYAGNATFDFLGATTTDSTDRAAQIFVGYRFTRWLGAEIGYQDLGGAGTFYSLHSNQPVFNAVPLLLRGEYRVRDFNGALVASWPLAESFELLARGGIASTRFDYDEHGNDAGGHPYSFHARTRTRSNAQAGIGALWRFAPHFALRLDLDRNFDVGKTFALNPDGNGHFDHIDAYTLNLLWQP